MAARRKATGQDGKSLEKKRKKRREKKVGKSNGSASQKGIKSAFSKKTQPKGGGRKKKSFGKHAEKGKKDGWGSKQPSMKCNRPERSQWENENFNHAERIMEEKPCRYVEKKDDCG